MKDLSNKKEIKKAIQSFWIPFSPGDQFRSEEILKSVQHQLGIQYIYPDTVLRYARELREEGKINYECIHKRERIIKVL